MLPRLSYLLIAMLMVSPAFAQVGAQEVVDTTQQRVYTKEQKASRTKKLHKMKKKNIVRATVANGDTVPEINLPAYTLLEERKFKSKKERKQYSRLLRDVRIVYPYAKKAGELLKKYESELEGEDSERKRKKYFKKVEKELEAEFGDELKALTIRQGRILIRLIDRETGDTSYELVSELRNGFTAFFFQGAARLFGHNLKAEYNPEEGEDEMIEDIIKRIENGQISVD